MFRTRSPQTPPLTARPSEATLAAFAAAARPMLFDRDSHPDDWHRIVAAAQRVFIDEKHLEVTDAELDAAHAVAVADIDAILHSTSRRGHTAVISDRTVTAYARRAVASVHGYVCTSAIVVQVLGALACLVLSALMAWSGWAGDVIDGTWPPAHTPIEQMRAGLSDGTTVIVHAGLALVAALLVVEIALHAARGPHRRPRPHWRWWAVRFAAVVATAALVTTAASVAYQIGIIVPYTY